MPDAPKTMSTVTSSSHHNSPQSSHQRWETRVIHLNIANDPPAAPAQGPPPSAATGQAPNPLFSQSYLKQEFPDHYAASPPAGGEQAQHPAVQLQGFINGLGQEGWEFVGVFPIGQLVMMFFRRPFLPEPGQQSPQAASATPPLPPPSAVGLDQILQRLEALERAAGSKPLSRVTPLRSTARILTAMQVQQLPQAPVLSTQDAATALGLRSSGGLLTYGSRHGYPEGLVKVAGSGMAAVYLGTEKRQRGGSSIRLWKVIPQSALPIQ